MGKAIKWILLVAGGLVALVIIALLVIPMFVDVQDYKPQIEEMVSDATGRPFTLGGDMDLSLFPWAGISISDVRMGNPPGFEETDFLSIQSFEVRIKLLPLMGKNIEVKRFILGSPRCVLIKQKDGSTNWEGFGKPGEKPGKAEKAPAEKPSGALPIESLAVGAFSVTDGTVIYIDKASNQKMEVTRVTLTAENVSLDKPMNLALSALLDGKNVSLDGTVGPIGKDFSKATIPLDIKAHLLDEMQVALTGQVVDPASNLRYDISLDIPAFSPRALVKSLGQPFPVETTDPEALDRLAIKGKVKGSSTEVSFTEGILDLDESRMHFSLEAKEFSRPDLAFDMNLDKINLDRYLPPAGEEEAPKEKPAPKGEKKKADYTPLRRLEMDGRIRIGELTAKGAKVQDLEMKVTAGDGLFRMDPLNLKMYEGTLAGKGAFDVRRDVPKTDLDVKAKQIQVNPLLNDLLKKDFLEGTVEADINMSMAGDDAELIKKTLGGKGNLLFTDGAIRGVNLTGMVRNVKSAFRLEQAEKQESRTDFSELRIPFTAADGVVKTPNSSLVSPLLRLTAMGSANLVEETLNFRVEPKVVSTLKGKGDEEKRSGIMVPVKVSGTFSSPKFRPDVEGAAKEKLKEVISDPQKVKEMLKGKETEGEKTKSLEDQAKDLIKGLGR